MEGAKSHQTNLRENVHTQLVEEWPTKIIILLPKHATQVTHLQGQTPASDQCRSIMHYTSYLRTKDCTNNGYVMDMLEHNTMINIDTGVHMISHNTQT